MRQYFWMMLTAGAVAAVVAYHVGRQVAAAFSGIASGINNLMP